MAYIGNSPANVGNYQIVDSIASSFNGSLTSFALASAGSAITPAKSGQLLIGLNGVMQQPDDTGANGFKVSGSNIVFSSAPASGDAFWGVYQGQQVDIGVPSTDSVDTVHLKDNSITTAKLAPGAVIESDVANNSITNVKMADDAIGLAELNATGTPGNTTFLRGDNAWATPPDTNTVYTHPNHSGEVTSTADGAQVVADNIIDEANLKVSNSPTNGYVLTAQSGNTGGMTWAEMTGGGPSLGTDSIIRTNAQTINEDITIGSTTNGMSAGPITIADTKTVTVNGNWSIV